VLRQFQLTRGQLIDGSATGMPQLHHIPREYKNIQVAIRFILRIVILCVFARLGNIDFARSLVALLWMSGIMSIAVAVIRRESIFDSTITYWDEAAAYGSLCCLASALLAAS
jgi:hypothetical protein